MRMTPGTGTVRRRRTIPALIGEAHIARPPHLLEAVLGSCIGLVIFDRRFDYAGMAHVLLPHGTEAESGGLPAKYANLAVPCLLNGLRSVGCLDKNLASMIAGGANMFQKQHGDRRGIGEANVQAIRRELQRERVPVVEEYVSGDAGRRILFDPRKRTLVVKVLDKNPV